jgi:hypothetical protein
VPPSYRAPISSVEDDPSWIGLLAAILLLVFIGPFLFGILPLPFTGLLILLVLGALARGVRP